MSVNELISEYNVGSILRMSFSVTTPIVSPLERTGSLLKLRPCIFFNARVISADGLITATFFVAIFIAFSFFRS